MGKHGRAMRKIIGETTFEKVSAPVYMMSQFLTRRAHVELISHPLAEVCAMTVETPDGTERVTARQRGDVFELRNEHHDLVFVGTPQECVEYVDSRSVRVADISPGFERCRLTVSDFDGVDVVKDVLVRPPAAVLAVGWDGSILATSRSTPAVGLTAYVYPSLADYVYCATLGEVSVLRLGAGMGTIRVPDPARYPRDVMVREIVRMWWTNAGTCDTWDETILDIFP